MSLLLFDSFDSFDAEEAVVSNLATIASIRDRIIARTEAIAPTSLSHDKFRAYRNEGDADFTAWAEANSAGAFRRFQVRETADAEEGPDVSNVTEERVRTVLEMRVAYPQTARTGKQWAMDRDDVMQEDWMAINAIAGIYSRAQFFGTADCTPLGATREREEGDGVDFLVVMIGVEYMRDTYA